MHRKIISIAITAVTLLASAGAHAQQHFREEPFTDVAETHANFEAIEYLRLHNVLKGYTDGTFRPNRRITRAEFIVLATNPYFLSGRSNDCLKTHFSTHASTRVFLTDVALNAWYAQDVCEAIVHDIIHGYADGTFKPNHNITFVEAAKVVARIFKLNTERVNPADEHWYVIYAQTLSKLRAIPLTIKTFTQPITRGEMAEIIFRLKTSNTTKASANYENLK